VKRRVWSVVGQSQHQQRRESERVTHLPTHTMAEIEEERTEGEKILIQKQVYDLAYDGELVELGALLGEHPDVDVDGYRPYGWHERGKHMYGWRALYNACRRGHTGCAKLLIEHKADIDVIDQNWSFSALHAASERGRLGWCVCVHV
jgi:hypothetical protein